MGCSKNCNYKNENPIHKNSKNGFLCGVIISRKTKLNNQCGTRYWYKVTCKRCLKMNNA